MALKQIPLSPIPTPREFPFESVVYPTSDSVGRVLVDALIARDPAIGHAPSDVVLGMFTDISSYTAAQARVDELIGLRGDPRLFWRALQNRHGALGVSAALAPYTIPGAALRLDAESESGTAVRSIRTRLSEEGRWVAMLNACGTPSLSNPEAMLPFLLAQAVSIGQKVNMFAGSDRKVKTDIGHAPEWEGLEASEKLATLAAAAAFPLKIIPKLPLIWLLTSASVARDIEPYYSKGKYARALDRITALSRIPIHPLFFEMLRPFGPRRVTTHWGVLNGVGLPRDALERIFPASFFDLKLVFNGHATKTMTATIPLRAEWDALAQWADGLWPSYSAFVERSRMYPNLWTTLGYKAADAAARAPLSIASPEIAFYTGDASSKRFGDVQDVLFSWRHRARAWPWSDMTFSAVPKYGSVHDLTSGVYDASAFKGDLTIRITPEDPIVHGADRYGRLDPRAWRTDADFRGDEDAEVIPITLDAFASYYGVTPDVFTAMVKAEPRLWERLFEVDPVAGVRVVEGVRGVWYNAHTRRTWDRGVAVPCITPDLVFGYRQESRWTPSGAMAQWAIDADRVDSPYGMAPALEGCWSWFTYTW